MAMTGKVLPYKKGFGPFPSDVYHVPFPIEHQGVTVADSLKAINFLFKADIDPARVAAIILEPVQGEGGFYVAPKELLVELRRLCDAHGILLISDEVQAGFARTGKMFGIEHSGVEPDLIAIAKSLAGASPSRASSAGPRSWTPATRRAGRHLCGSPVACAAALESTRAPSQSDAFLARVGGRRRAHPGRGCAALADARSRRSARCAVIGADGRDRARARDATTQRARTPTIAAATVAGALERGTDPAQDRHPRQRDPDPGADHRPRRGRRRRP